MRFSESEIVEDILKHIRQGGGEFREWRVGTAQDKGIRCQVPGVREQEAESLFHREAYTTYAAQEVVERLAQGFGLALDREASPNGGAITPLPGRVVYVYRASAAARTEVLEHRV